MRAAWRQTSFDSTTKGSKRAKIGVCILRASSHASHFNCGLRFSAPWASDAFNPARLTIPAPQAYLRRSSSSNHFFADNTTLCKIDLGTSTDTIDMTLLQAAAVFTTQHSRISAAAKGTRAPHLAHRQTLLEGSH